MEQSAKDDGSLYDTDFYAWTRQQSELIRARRFDGVDAAHLVEELETLGRAEYHALRSSYRLVMMHLLKMRYQPTHRTDSWSATIARERNAIEDAFDDNPGLRPRRREIAAKAYPGARREASVETKLAIATFPVDCPFSLDEIEDHGFWPGAAPVP